MVLHSEADRSVLESRAVLGDLDFPHPALNAVYIFTLASFKDSILLHPAQVGKELNIDAAAEIGAEPLGLFPSFREGSMCRLQRAETFRYSNARFPQRSRMVSDLDQPHE